MNFRVYLTMNRLLLDLFLTFQDIKMCQRPHRDRTNTAEGAHHHHSGGHHHHHHHHHRGHHVKASEGDREVMGGASQGPQGVTSDVCCHGQPRYPYAPYVEGSPTHKRSHRKRDGGISKDTPQYGPSKRSKQRYREGVEYVQYL